VAIAAELIRPEDIDVDFSRAPFLPPPDAPAYLTPTQTSAASTPSSPRCASL
jgi:hypothetical protein